MVAKLLTVVGARPQFVKAGAVSRVIRTRPEVKEVMVHTGQHFDDNMSAVFFQELDIPVPAYNLDIHGSSHGEMTGRMIEGLEGLMIGEKPDWVLVYGDTNSTLAAALAAAKLNLPVAHVEAGLRSFNRLMPEEINRVVTDHVSALLFCPTRAAVGHLKREGIRSGVCHVGDVMYDASLHAGEQAKMVSRILDRLKLGKGGFALATVHRAENTDDPMRLSRIFEFLKAQALQHGALVLPLHPRTRHAAIRYGIPFDDLIVIDPVGYLDMVQLLSSCEIVFTDSGGVQKEAYFHRKPCVTMRSETEWVETVECGWNRLWDDAGYAPRRDIPDYGCGDAASKIVNRLLS